MKNTKILIALSLCSLLVIGCTIQKRVHLKGYAIEWKKKYEKTDGKLVHNDKVSEKLTVFEPESAPLALEQVDRSESTFEITDTEDLSFTENQINPKYITAIEDCDVIFLKNGDEIRAKVLEVTQLEVKYKDCANLDGPIFTKDKTEIFKINYQNGTSSVFENSNANNPNKKTEKKPSSIGENGDRSFLIAVVIWFFIGFLGIHRFYLGHYGIGILYLLTGALCGIGWIIDGILFLTGGLRPARGEYID